LTKVRYRYLGLLLLCTLFSFAVVTAPASAAAPSWVSDGKYATYYGGFKFELGTPGQEGYIKLQFTVTTNWSLSDTLLTQTMVSGGWNISIYLNFNNTVLFSGGFGTTGTEVVRLDTGTIITGGGFDFIGMEILGSHTVLWVDSTASMPPAGVSIGGRHAVNATGSMTIPFIPNATIPITRFYDSETGMLLGFNLVLNITGMGFPAPAWHGASDMIGWSNRDGVVNVKQIPGLGSLGEIAFPVVISNTNVIPYAWNPGGDITLWLMATGALLGLSALFGLLVYAKKR
jgi:hypothetical protein